MMRGDLVTIAVQGGFGKPRPALVIQANPFNANESLTVLPVTSTLVNAPLLRIDLAPDTGNGLKRKSQVMVDKALNVRRTKVGPVIGCIDADVQVAVDRCLAVFLGIAK